VEVKPQSFEISGYSLQSLSYTGNDSILWEYIFNGIDMFLERIVNNNINKIKNSKEKNVLYINCLGKFMSTYNKLK
jgi:hypothetical protein